MAAAVTVYPFLRLQTGLAGYTRGPNHRKEKTKEIRHAPNEDRARGGVRADLEAYLTPHTLPPEPTSSPTLP